MTLYWLPISNIKGTATAGPDAVVLSRNFTVPRTPDLHEAASPDTAHTRTVLSHDTGDDRDELFTSDSPSSDTVGNTIARTTVGRSSWRTE